MSPQVSFGWETIQLAIETLAYQLGPTKPLGIVGIARGGLIPATMLSHKLNVPVLTISASSYHQKDHTQKPNLTLDVHDHVMREVKANPARWIFIDDVLDSGNTYDAVKEVFRPLCLYAVIVTKRQILQVPSFATVPKDVWVKFPWE